MPEFKSKIQHKTYEKGEFTDEKVRSLDETIELIKKFPWDTERGVDIQLTGPSITIQDEHLNYLKIALYFNGKFCLYYLDCDNHLFEYHASDLEEAIYFVNDFFVNQLDLQKFDKHLFSAGAKSHFENGSFDYTLKSSAVAFYVLLMVFFSAIALGYIYALFKVKDIPWPAMCFFIFIDGLILTGLYTMYQVLVLARKMLVKISTGHDEFQFGQGNDIRSYNKKDVASLNVYGGVRSSIVDLMELVFKNGDVIQIPGIIINQYTLREKFPAIKANLISRFFTRINEISKAAKNVARSR